MNLITAALRRPLTVVVAILGLVFFSGLAIRQMPIDIFPQLGLPTVYVAQPYGGLSPEQVEGLITSYYEYHFLYVTGIKFVDSKSVQGMALLKLQFQPGTDMNQAIAEVVGYVNRARAFMPPGTVPPFITRFDAGSVPVGQLVFTSDTKTLGEIQDLALFKVRPLFSTLPGVSAPPPFGGNQKTVVVRVDPERLRSYGLAPEAVVQALAKGNTITPAGNVRIGDELVMTPQNSLVDNIQELGNVALQPGSGPAVYLRDLATVELGADVTTGYALINGKRSVYLNVSKRADASTWNVVQAVKANLPAMQAAVPPDIKVSYEFDQSGYVINSLKSLLFEGGLGALLTGLMVLLFLGDRRSALIVVLTIPIALLAGATGLYLAGQTINIMTLGGLALAVGILVDEATVTIENIHRHQELGQPKVRAIFDACQEIAGPKLLILLSILAVFVPALFMSGVPRAMFLPLALAVGFAMIASFLLSQTLVPVVANWYLKDHVADPAAEPKETRFDRFRQRFSSLLTGLLRRSAVVIPAYLVLALLALGVGYHFLGTEIFPKVDTGQFQVRLRLPTGTRIERTEDATQQVLGLVQQLAGPGNVAITSAFVGTQPSSYPINTIYLWTSGPHEAVLKVNLNPKAGLVLEEFKERLRAQAKQKIPQLALSFEPGDLVEQVLNLGATTPVEVAVVGKDLAQGRQVAERLRARLAAIPYLRDVQFGLPLDYPTLNIHYDRVRLSQLGLTVDQVSRSMVAATSSSRFTQPNYWIDKKTGTSYQVQVEVPPFKMASAGDVEGVPVGTRPPAGVAGANGRSGSVYFRDVADWSRGTAAGEYDRLNQQRYLTLTANVHGQDLGTATRGVQKAIDGLGALPAGVKILVRGQAELLGQTLSELQLGLGLAIGVIFLLLAANFQSFKLSLAILSTLPAVLAGALLLLLLTGKTLNLQSFMGCIMAIGVAVANAILLVTSAEAVRRGPDAPDQAALVGATTRLRPILMTSLAMMAGMVPMALGLGEGGEQTAPLGMAVIGGLLFSTLSTLLVLPLVYRAAVGRAAPAAVSLDPTDEHSQFYGQ